MSTLPVIAPLLALLNSRAFVLMVITALVDALIGAVPSLLPLRDQFITIFTGLAALVIAKIGVEDAAYKYGLGQVAGQQAQLAIEEKPNA